MPHFRTITWILLGALVLLFVTVLVTVYSKQPTNDRAWAEDQKILPYAEFDSDMVTVKNIRNFSYQSRDEYTPLYYDKTFPISDIVSIDYIVEPLASVAAAHTFLSFGLKDGSQIAVSIEIRKEQDEEFSPFKGLFRAYEIMYVVVDERDALGLRAVHRDNPVYIYRTIATPEMSQTLFVDMMRRATALRDTPEFYNTITNTCATNIVDHINLVVPNRIGWDYRLLLPMNSDLLAYEQGLLAGDASIEDLRTAHYASDAIKEHVDSPEFSRAIRSELPGFATND